MSQHCYHHSNKTPQKEENNCHLGEHSSVIQQQQKKKTGHNEYYNSRLDKHLLILRQQQDRTKGTKH